jgi:hypothetical protein
VIWVGAHVDEYRSSGKPCREFREKVQGRLQETGVFFFFFFPEILRMTGGELYLPRTLVDCNKQQLQQM